MSSPSPPSVAVAVSVPPLVQPVSTSAVAAGSRRTREILLRFICVPLLVVVVLWCASDRPMAGGCGRASLAAGVVGHRCRDAILSSRVVRTKETRPSRMAPMTNAQARA